MSKVTMQDIADSLGISRVTVWKVFNHHDGVSQTLRENVLNRAKELGYSRAGQSARFPDEEKTVSLIVSRPDSSTFWTNIIHRLAQELSHHNVNLMYTYVPSDITEDFSLPQVLTGGAIQGAIILNIYDAGLTGLIRELELPKVFLDTIPQIASCELNGDLLLLEGRNSIRRITESVLARGITQIGFIGDIHYARTNLERYEGFCQCMQEHRLQICESFCLTSRIGIFSYYEELCSFLDSLEVLPQAFICASDYIAHFLQRYFSEHPGRIPSGIVVTGYDGSREYSNIDGMITTADVKTGLLGKRLSMQIMYRMEHADAPYELTYIRPEIICRDSVIY